VFGAELGDGEHQGLCKRPQGRWGAGGAGNPGCVECKQLGMAEGCWLLALPGSRSHSWGCIKVQRAIQPPSHDHRFCCHPHLTGAQGLAGAHPWGLSSPWRCGDAAVTQCQPELGLGGSALLWLVQLELGKVLRALLDPGAFAWHEVCSAPSSAV